jgi:hypothetical protein
MKPNRLRRKVKEYRVAWQQMTPDEKISLVLWMGALVAVVMLVVR